MKKIILAAAAVILLSMVARGADITMKQLPKTAQAFITQYFPTDRIAKIGMNTDRSTKEYKVLFQDGSKIKFDQNGQWTKIKLRNDSIPVEIIPEYITTYVWEMYPNILIMSIEQEGTGHEVELSDGTELTFNAKGNVVKID
ncbi:MAG: PepSY-like domain-containing protein [Tidjanibacter sp.]|nr:PepSY-like domain-containing protein [Tidjanibacter sp.]